MIEVMLNLRVLKLSANEREEEWSKSLYLLWNTDGGTDNLLFLSGDSSINSWVNFTLISQQIDYFWRNWYYPFPPWSTISS